MAILKTHGIMSCGHYDSSPGFTERRKNLVPGGPVLGASQGQGCALLALPPRPRLLSEPIV